MKRLFRQRLVTAAFLAMCFQTAGGQEMPAEYQQVLRELGDRKSVV